MRLADVVAYLAVLAVLVLCAGAWWAFRAIPRLRVEPTLRGTTRAGHLYVLVHNDGWRPARKVELRVAWAADGRESPIDSIVIDEVEGRGAATVRVDDLHRGVPAGVTWDRIVATARARFAWSGRGAIDLSARAASAATGSAPPVVYKPLGETCPRAPDGKHWIQAKRFLNDGVEETWSMCRRCAFVKREPLTPEQEAVQQRVRRERAREEQRRLEEEFDRGRRQERAPPRSPDEDRLPVEIAFYLLGLDEKATWDDVEAAYKRLAKDAHPDRAGGADPRVRAVLEERMRDLNRARDRLRERFGGGRV